MPSVTATRPYAGDATDPIVTVTVASLQVSTVSCFNAIAKVGLRSKGSGGRKVEEEQRKTKRRIATWGYSTADVFSLESPSKYLKLQPLQFLGSGMSVLILNGGFEGLETCFQLGIYCSNSPQLRGSSASMGRQCCGSARQYRVNARQYCGSARHWPTGSLFAPELVCMMNKS
ncbi:hypothetical protein K438DRAFT_1775574 [Mycena galopus ATCC 62051]|nr:hypothetical protein K438DRAFT_1775574 [Mycena galopus ATCC 62051]